MGRLCAAESRLVPCEGGGAAFASGAVGPGGAGEGVSRPLDPVFLFSYMWPLGNIVLPLVAASCLSPEPLAALWRRRHGAELGAAAAALRGPASISEMRSARAPPGSSSQPRAGWGAQPAAE